MSLRSDSGCGGRVLGASTIECALMVTLTSIICIGATRGVVVCGRLGKSNSIRCAYKLDQPSE